METKRIDYLDYLRGLAAVGIMVYHYLSWSRGSFNASDVFGRIGIYGVSIFYVLSGLTLYHVYFNQSPTKKTIINFSIKRIFRIVPLYALITILSILNLGKPVPVSDLILNLTCLFGFIYPGGYYTNGGWSIGNEMVFYLFFVFYFLSFNKNKIIFTLSGILTLTAYLVYSNVIIVRENTIDNQWLYYINPFNQLFLFLGGILIGLISNQYKSYFNNSISLFSIVVAVLLFVFIPSPASDRVLIITGFYRICFTVVCFLICFGLYNLTFQLPKFIHKVGVFFGEISYCLYLVHGLCFAYSQYILNYFFHAYPERYRFLFAIALTISFSYLSYITFEKYFIKLGKKLTQKLNGKPETLH